MKRVEITADDAGQRLDKFLSKYLRTMPKSLLYKAIRKKRVKRNGKRASEQDKLVCGDVLELYINDEFFEDTGADDSFRHIMNPRVDVVYEDENLLLVNKPQGMLVHADDAGGADTLIAHIQSYLYQTGAFDPAAAHTFAPALVNRIDRNTQGIVIAAKNAESLRLLSEIVKTRQIHKYYQCVVHGAFSSASDTLTAYLRKDASGNRVQIFDRPAEGARTIVTQYRVLKSRNGLSLLEVELITGRTHQIRAHMAHIGHPLFGDGKYGVLKPDAPVKRQALCSYRLTFDFQNDFGILNYLNGRSFTIQTDLERFLN